MKTKIWKCCTAVLSILALSPSLDVHGMARIINPSEQIFGSSFGFMRDVYGKSKALVIRELWYRKSNVEDVVFSLFGKTLNEHLAIGRKPIDPANPKKTKIENWKDLKAIFVQQLLGLPNSLTLKEWQKHFGKHVFPIAVLNARRNAEAGNFYGESYIIGEDEEGDSEALNSVIIVKSEDSVGAAMSFFAQGNPELEFRDGGIFLSLNNPGFTLSKIDYERCFCIFGAPKKNLTEGFLQPIPSDYARDIQIYGGIKLNCFSEDGSITHPGTLYPKISRQLAQTIRALPPTSEQAELAALLGFKHTLECVDFNNTHLMDAMNKISAYLVSQAKDKEEISLYSPIMGYLDLKLRKKRIELKRRGEGRKSLEFMFPGLGFLEHTETLSKEKSKILEQFHCIVSEYQTFFQGDAVSLEKIMRYFFQLEPEIPLEEGIFEWSQKDRLMQVLETRPDIKERLSAFSKFVFLPENSIPVYETLQEVSGCELNIRDQSLGTIVPNTIRISLLALLMNKSLSREWLKNNLYHFSLLYMFADSKLVSNDYFGLLYAFLSVFPQGTWSYPIEGTDPLILTDQMNLLLSMSKIHSSDLSPAQMKKLGFSEWIDLAHTNLTLEKIAKLKNRFTTEKMKDFGFKGNIAKYAAIYINYASSSPTDDLIMLCSQYIGNFDMTIFNQKLEELKKSLCFKLLKRALAIPEKTNEVKMQLEKLPKIEDKIDALVKIIDESDS